MKNILINIKTKYCPPKSMLRWEFASVYMRKRSKILSVNPNRRKWRRWIL